MSNVYQLEPPTEGKVLLTTSHGEIEIELWAKEAPKACRNFVQLCLEGYYEDCIFHRIIKDFCIQTGDPTGTGQGGDSIYGEPFKDELHSRIKFNHRGQVAMANAGSRDTNGSQFFITLERCDWIDRKHTIFGKVVGHTIYNALQIAELEVEGDRPVEPHPKIIKAEVLWNPFEDIVPRVVKGLADDAEDAGEKKKRKKKETKKLNLLSFGEEAGEEDAELATMAKPKVKSVFDAEGDDASGRIVKPGSEEEAAALRKDSEELERTKAFRERMRAKLAAHEAGESLPPDDDDDENDDHVGFEEKMRAKIIAKKEEFGTTVVEEELRAREAAAEKRAKKERREGEKARREAERRAKEATRLRKLGIGKNKLAEEDAALMTDKEVKRVEMKRKRKAVGGREKDMLSKLAKFETGLKTSLKESAAKRSKSAATDDADAAAKEKEGGAEERDGAIGVSRYVSEGLYYADSESDDDGADWKSHSLKFSKETRVDLGSYMASVDDYVVEDPLLEKGKGKFRDSKAAKKMNQWAGGSLT